MTKVVERVQRGQILSQPSACPHQVYEVRPVNILRKAVLLMPIRVRISILILIQTMLIHIRLLPQVLQMLENQNFFSSNF